jgi:hypothetical protein
MLSTITHPCIFVNLAILYCRLVLLDGYMAIGPIEETRFQFPLPLFLLHYEFWRSTRIYIRILNFH